MFDTYINNMRVLFFVFILLSSGLLVYSIIQLNQQLSNNIEVTLVDLKGFEDTGTTSSTVDNPYKSLLKEFKDKIFIQSTLALKHQNLYFWMTFIVTILTAASTLVSSIQAARKEPPESSRIQASAILIAILTFGSTVTNFAASHFNVLKTEETKKAVDLSADRNQFFVDYNRASPDDKPSVIEAYRNRL